MLFPIFNSQLLLVNRTSRTKIPKLLVLKVVFDYKADQILFLQLLKIESTDIKNLICDPSRLGKLIRLPETTNITVTEVSLGLCGLNNAKAVPVSETLIQNLEVGNLIKDVRFIYALYV